MHWHKQMYDESFAGQTIGSGAFIKQARVEARAIAEKLQLQKNARHLDVPCGAGRHSRAFSKLGFQVTGVDISPLLIRSAKKATVKKSPKSQQKRPQFYVGDMQNLKRFHGQFDLVTNLFTSFGYFDQETQNLAVLRQLKNALKPGGRLVMSLVNHEWLKSIYQPVSFTPSSSGLIIETRRMLNDRQIETHRFQVNHGKEVTLNYNRAWLYSVPEMKKLLKAAGLKNIQVYGDYQFKPVSRKTSSHPVYIARR